MSSLYMETTKIEAAKTVSEISVLLAQAGVTQIMQEYAGGMVCGLSFSITVQKQVVPFRLPAKTEPVFKIINSRRPVRTREKYVEQDREQAIRVAWRQLLRWIQAQLALIETGMVSIDEVFMPYIRLEGGKTFYQQLADTNYKKLLPNLEQ